MSETKTISLRLPIEEIEELREAKWDLRMPVNTIIRKAIDEYLEKNWRKSKKRRSSK